MSTPFFISPPIYVETIISSRAVTIQALCNTAGVKCQASGSWINRRVEIKHGPRVLIEAEPGDWGTVRITMPKTNKIEEARVALTILAYSLHDLVAKQSIKGQLFSKVPNPRGRKRTGKALSNAERQRLHRERRVQ